MTQFGIDIRFEHLIGLPHRDFGRGPDFWDCYGIVIESGRILGYETPDWGSVPSKENDEAIDALVGAHKHEARKLDGPKPGAVVLFFSLIDPGKIDHMGRMISETEFIHSRHGSGVQVTRISHSYWKRRIEGFYWWTIKS